MESQKIQVGNIVRHNKIMQGTNLFVVSIKGDKLIVRYASQGIFQTQDLLLVEVSPYEEEEDEYL
jgi:hypothetical protein